MNLELVQNTIEQLENLDTTFENCQNLASLYIVRDMYKPRKSQLLEDELVAKELSDIFPQYRNYREIKKKYQLKELDKSALIHSMELLGQELEEFLTLLYKDTDTQEERDLLEKILQRTLFFYQKTA